jgi:hypothetical protein
LNYHVWVNSAGHTLGAYHNDDEWHSKTTASSGHSHSGKGADALNVHLTSKAKRYNLQHQTESKVIPNLPILENLQEAPSQRRHKVCGLDKPKNPSRF